ncbi:MAG TPA: thiosulfate oxidation carrier complex protein SoxZ [Burkholderiales bacterium]
MAARIRLPKPAKRGEVIRVRLLIQHPMETGYRLDASGRKVPKNAIRSLVCRYSGVEVFRAELSPGIAANPFLEFPTIATESGELEFTWVDDAGVQGRAVEPITVA